MPVDADALQASSEQDIQRSREVTRRTVVVGGIGVGALVMTTLGGEPAFAAAPPRQAPQVTEVLDAKVLDGTLTAYRLLGFPVALRLGAGGALRTRQIAVRYDSRVFAIYGAHVVRTDGAVSNLEVSHVASGSVVEASLRVPLAAGETAMVRFGVARVDRYPADGVTGPVATEVLVDGVVIEAYPPSPAAAATTWGVEVYPIWSGVAVRSKANVATYRFPVGARILSVGPASTPEGLELDVSFDSRAIAALGLGSSTSTSARGAASLSQTATDLLVISLPSIPAGESLDLRFAPRLKDSIAPFRSVRHGVIDVVLPLPSGDTFIRSTGRYSVPDLTVSGNGTVESAIEGDI
jgi:hypothetical protein